MNKEETRAYNKRYREKNKEKLKAYEKKRSQTKKRKDASKEYRERPETKNRIRKHRQTSEYKAFLKKYRQTPERKAQRKTYQRKNRPSINAKSREYNQAPERKSIIKKNRKDKKLEIISIFKEDQKCTNCGYNEYPKILHFHHTNPKEKEFNIGNIKSLKKIEAEAKKCILLCPNCHSWLHFTVSRMMK